MFWSGTGEYCVRRWGSDNVGMRSDSIHRFSAKFSPGSVSLNTTALPVYSCVMEPGQNLDAGMPFTAVDGAAGSTILGTPSADYTYRLAMRSNSMHSWFA
jgi:hypothetical protein